MRLPCRRPLVVVLLCAQLAACTTWQRPRTGVAPAELVAHERPSRIRIRTATDAQFVIGNPSLVGDSIIGTTVSRRPRPAAVAVGDVTDIRVRRVSAAATVAGVVGGVALGLATAAAIWAATWDGPFGSCCQ